MLSKIRTYPSENLCKEAGILNIKQLFVYRIMNIQLQNKTDLNIEHKHGIRYKTKTKNIMSVKARKKLDKGVSVS